MPRDIGPDMLRNLDEQLAAGRIDQASYESRKVEVMELIRRGRAVELSRTERIWRLGGGGVVVIAGVWVLATGLDGAWFVGIGLIAFGIWVLRQAFR